jgi:hypothetical protein
LKYGLSYQWRDWENEKWWKEILAETGRKRPRRGEEGGPPVGD